MKEILLIGGEGYIGNSVTQHLLGKGYSVTSFDNLLYENHTCVLSKISNKNYSFKYGDLLDGSLLKPLIRSHHAVVLLAGLVGDPITKKYPYESAKINDLGVKNVIDLCSEASTKKFIFVSTCSNYGLIEEDHLADENHPLNPLSLYAESKTNAEQYILSMKNKTGMNPTILRFATAFGLSARTRFDLTINEFTRDLAMGQDLLVYDADTWRPYCHVNDFARLIEIVISSPVNKTSFEVFNAGGNINNATKEMILSCILKRIPNGKVSFQKHGSDPRNYRVSFQKVESILDFEPRYTIEDGVNELIDAIDNHVFDNIDRNRNFYGNYEINYPI
ncbi:MAG: NAD(P)-dependent oxidoreductase [Gammaproteobacteria bacterium]|nr:NAD(P)-dependent oxidoreductase [Gammaproteobacteria bacterium]